MKRCAFERFFRRVVPESLGGGVAWTQGQSDADRSVERCRDGVGNLQLRSESAYLFVHYGESIQNKTIKTKKIGSLSQYVELTLVVRGERPLFLHTIYGTY